MPIAVAATVAAGTGIFIAAMILGSIHKQPAANAPSSSPSSSGVQASGTSPDKPIGTASPTTTAIARRDPGARRQIQAASNRAATINHCSVCTDVLSCSPITSSPGPPSRRKRIARPPRVSSATRSERRARSPRWTRGCRGAWGDGLSCGVVGGGVRRSASSSTDDGGGAASGPVTGAAPVAASAPKSSSSISSMPCAVAKWRRV